MSENWTKGNVRFCVLFFYDPLSVSFFPAISHARQRQSYKVLTQEMADSIFGEKKTDDNDDDSRPDDDGGSESIKVRVRKKNTTTKRQWEVMTCFQCVLSACHIHSLTPDV